MDISPLELLCKLKTGEIKVTIRDEDKELLEAARERSASAVETGRFILDSEKVEPLPIAKTDTVKINIPITLYDKTLSFLFGGNIPINSIELMRMSTNEMLWHGLDVGVFNFNHLFSIHTDTGEDAILLLVKNGISLFLDQDEVINLYRSYKDDTYHSRLKNSIKSYFGDNRIVSSSVLKHVKSKAEVIKGDNSDYYIGIRLGKSTDMYFQWWCNSKPASDKISIQVDHGDLVILSSKCTGRDWRSRTKMCIRHTQL